MRVGKAIDCTSNFLVSSLLRIFHSFEVSGPFQTHPNPGKINSGRNNCDLSEISENQNSCVGNFYEREILTQRKPVPKPLGSVRKRSEFILQCSSTIFWRHLSYQNQLFSPGGARKKFRQENRGFPDGFCKVKTCIETSELRRLAGKIHRNQKIQSRSTVFDV